jgi:hypothetical protein
MLVARNREAWPDAVKIVACILVVLGHLTQSMVKSDIMPADSLYGWFQMTIYTFHVPLFFICSGYLYQSFTRMESAIDWWFNVRKKLLVLGMPYFVFTGITLAMKAVAGDAVNNVAEYGAVETLFLNPTAPYWYLYALFFMFLTTPVARNECGITTTVAVACGAKVISFSGITENISFSVWIGPKAAESREFQLCRDETMPVYLMHTICAGPIRIVLLRVGVTAAVLHMVLGLIGSFAGPAFAMWLMERLRPLDFFVYPSRYVKLKRRA